MAEEKTEETPTPVGTSHLGAIKHGDDKLENVCERPLSKGDVVLAMDDEDSFGLFDTARENGTACSVCSTIAEFMGKAYAQGNYDGEQRVLAEARILAGQRKPPKSRIITN